MRKRIKRNKPNEIEALEKKIRAHRADVAPYRLLNFGIKGISKELYDIAINDFLTESVP